MIPSLVSIVVCVVALVVMVRTWPGRRSDSLSSRKESE